MKKLKLSRVYQLYRSLHLAQTKLIYISTQILNLILSFRKQ